MRSRLSHPRDQIADTMARIYHYGMTTTSGGNISVRDPEGGVWISPARLDKGTLVARDVCFVADDGTTTDLVSPSSELPFHQAVYDARPDLGALIHAHPVALVAFSIGGAAPNTRLFPSAHRICGDPGFAEYALPGSAALGESIARSFASGHDSVVMQNHGVVVGGATLEDAYQRFEALEFTARIELAAAMIDDSRPTTLYPLDATAVPVASRGASAGASTVDADDAPAGSTERELRSKISELLLRGCRQRLLISTEGSWSARIDANRFVVTPRGIDREYVEPVDLVRVGDGLQQTHREPSRAVELHRAIYARNPDVQAIAFAHPIHSTAFSITSARLDARTIPESYLVLGDVLRVPPISSLAGADALTSEISLRRPAALIDGDGAAVVGDSLLAVYDRLEVLEATAETLVRSRFANGVAPLPEVAIAELIEAFGPT